MRADKMKNGAIWKMGLLLAGALITVGIYVATVRSNTARVEKVETKAHGTETAVVGMKKDIEFIKVTQTQILEEMKKWTSPG